jgi:hypothetical protein
MFFKQQIVPSLGPECCVCCPCFRCRALVRSRGLPLVDAFGVTVTVVGAPVVDLVAAVYTENGRKYKHSLVTGSPPPYSLPIRTSTLSRRNRTAFFPVVSSPRVRHRSFNSGTYIDPKSTSSATEEKSTDGSKPIPVSLQLRQPPSKNARTRERVHGEQGLGNERMGETHRQSCPSHFDLLQSQRIRLRAPETRHARMWWGVD